MHDRTMAERELRRLADEETVDDLDLVVAANRDARVAAVTLQVLNGALADGEVPDSAAKEFTSVTDSLTKREQAPLASIDPSHQGALLRLVTFQVLADALADDGYADKRIAERRTDTNG